MIQIVEIQNVKDPSRVLSKNLILPNPIPTKAARESEIAKIKKAWIKIIFRNKQHTIAIDIII